jgi:hypothetical protein
MATAVVALTGAPALAADPPPPPAAPCADCVGVVGDSLTFQAGKGEAQLTKAIKKRGYAPEKIKVDGLPSRSIAGSVVSPSSLDVIKSWRAAGFDPKIFVIALGSGNKNAQPAAWTKEVNKVLTEIGPGHEVHWIGLGFKDAADPRVQSFTDMVKVIPGLIFEDWNTYVRAQPQDGIWLAGDDQGVHMTGVGYVIRNTWTASVLPAGPIPPAVHGSPNAGPDQTQL